MPCVVIWLAHVYKPTKNIKSFFYIQKKTTGHYDTNNPI